jgi:hypothetical protein
VKGAKALANAVTYFVAVQHQGFDEVGRCAEKTEPFLRPMRQTHARRAYIQPPANNAVNPAAFNLK